MKTKFLKYVLAGTIFTAAMLFNFNLNNSKLNSGSISLQILEAKADFSLECNWVPWGWCRERIFDECYFLCEDILIYYPDYHWTPF
jgi:hypothetical protein